MKKYLAKALRRSSPHCVFKAAKTYLVLITGLLFQVVALIYAADSKDQGQVDLLHFELLAAKEAKVLYVQVGGDCR